MFGKIELEGFDAISEMPQGAASAWHEATGAIVGASYKPLLYLGWQIAHGVNHFFIAEQTLTTNPPIRRVVRLVISGGKIVSVEEILG